MLNVAQDYGRLLPNNFYLAFYKSESGTLAYKYVRYKIGLDKVFSFSSPTTLGVLGTFTNLKAIPFCNFAPVSFKLLLCQEFGSSIRCM